MFVNIPRFVVKHSFSLNDVSVRTRCESLHGTAVGINEDAPGSKYSHIRGAFAEVLTVGADAALT